MPKSMLVHQNSNRYAYTKSRHAVGKCIKQHAQIDDLLSTWVDFAWFLTGFSTPVRPCNRFFGARNSEKRLARIRTLARLRRSVYGFEAVVITTPPPPRLRVKGVRFEGICKRTLEAAGRLAGWLAGCRLAIFSFNHHATVLSEASAPSNYSKP